MSMRIRGSATVAFLLAACGGGTSEQPESAGPTIHRLPPQQPAEQAEQTPEEQPAQAEPPPRQLSPAPETREELVGRGADRVRVEVAPPAGATYATPACARGTREVCDGTDQECDGRIDNGCGYAAGDIQITLAWGTRSDLDLTVANPNGDVISWRVEQGYDGGQMDHRTEGCDGSPLGTAIPGALAQGAKRIENVFFTVPTHSRTARIARGRYVVAVRASDMCNETASPATVSIAVKGKVIATVQLPFERYDETFEIPFTLTDPQ